MRRSVGVVTRAAVVVVKNEEARSDFSQGSIRTIVGGVVARVCFCLRVGRKLVDFIENLSRLCTLRLDPLKAKQSEKTKRENQAKTQSRRSDINGKKSKCSGYSPNSHPPVKVLIARLAPLPLPIGFHHFTASLTNLSTHRTRKTIVQSSRFSSASGIFQVPRHQAIRLRYRGLYSAPKKLKLDTITAKLCQ